MKRDEKLYDALCEVIPVAKCELNYKDMYELLISVILSAQCTDRRVNEVTPKLFEKYPTVSDLAKADISDVQGIIHSLGFYTTKSRNIIACAQCIVTKFNGIVPDNMDDLVSLPGVGRKTASVVFAEGYKIPAIAVDTHVLRVSNRLGLSDKYDTRVTENSLKDRFDQNIWRDLHTRLVLFGRYYCKAQNPMCNDCKLQKYCKYYKTLGKNNQKLVKK